MPYARSPPTRGSVGCPRSTSPTDPPLPAHAGVSRRESSLRPYVYPTLPGSVLAHALPCIICGAQPNEGKLRLAIHRCQQLCSWFASAVARVEAPSQPDRGRASG